LRLAVLEELRNDIISGVYQPGDRLVEEEIAGRFDVSRNPIREALHTLSTEGFVVVEPRRGARVASVTAKQARELFELRTPLEGVVARLAAARRSTGDVDKLRRLVDRGVAAELDELPALNTQFHGALAEAAGNELLTGTLGRLSDIIRWIYAARIRERSQQSWIEHAGIVEAVAARDVELAERLGTEHIARASVAYEEAPR
jgi:DNA-binding GntR family transcriptional regulator